jgi:hypothetical protein
MSLFKAYNMTSLSPDLDQVRDDFMGVVNEVVEGDAAGTIEVSVAVALYAKYSVAYLREVSHTLEDIPSMSATMKFMNSYIAEIMHKANLHYYNQEHGFSIVDRAVQVALDNEGEVTMGDMATIIDEIESSYVPEEVDEEVVN